VTTVQSNVQPNVQWNPATTAGEIVLFGAWPQTATGADRTPIRWRVLQNAGDTLFLLSEYILDCKRYHGAYTDITWQDCDLRQWLNREFYSAAFTAAERERIQTAHCTDNGAGSPDTQDKVFLLSAAEVQDLTGKGDGDPLRVRRRTIGTEYAKVKKSDGCHLYVYDKQVQADYITEGGQEFGCSWWWLRTRGSTPSRAYFVGARNSIRSYARIDLARDGVRPAIKINLL